MKPTFVTQLCCYAEMLQEIQGKLPEHIIVALGSGAKETLKTKDYFHYYQSLKNSFIHDKNQFYSDLMPDPADSKHWANWSDYANQILKEQDHLLQFATITKSQIKKLKAAGILTMSFLADSSEAHIPGLNPSIFIRLKKQAAIQIASSGKDVPLIEIIQPNKDEKTGFVTFAHQAPH